MDVTGVAIIASKFAYLDKILLRRFYELYLHFGVQNLVNHSDWGNSFSDGRVIPATPISNCQLVEPIYPSNRQRGVGRRIFFIGTRRLYASSAACIWTTT
jgi:hypothetical protein